VVNPEVFLSHHSVGGARTFVIPLYSYPPNKESSAWSPELHTQNYYFKLSRTTPPKKGPFVYLNSEVEYYVFPLLVDFFENL